MWLSVFVFNFANGAMASFAKPQYKLSTLVTVSRFSNESNGRSISFGKMLWDIVLDNLAFGRKYEYFSALVTLCLLLLNLGLLLGTVSMVAKHSWKRRKIKNRITNAQNRHRRTFGPKHAAVNNFFNSFSQEFKLTVYSLFLLLCFFMSLLYVAIPAEKSSVLLDLKILILNLSLDILGVVNPFGLVLMSKDLRRKLTEFLLLGRPAFSPLGRKTNKGLIAFAVLYFLIVTMLIISIVHIDYMCIRRNHFYLTGDVSICRRAMEC